MANKTQIEFELLNETPGAVRYVEVDKDGTPLVDDASGARIGNLYFRKAKFAEVSADYASEGEAPKRITVTVETHDR